jgi:hypothetical protein
MARVYFESTTRWIAEIAPDLLTELSDPSLPGEHPEAGSDSGGLRLGRVNGDLAELLEIHGHEIDGPELTITQVEHA